ncbi:CoA pyrophosphatase [Salipiger sp. IMCC34102]|uniref:CoA pyrophosphatase n=1 Tax=Salipiger sp. IMCC34102 TaxID=2510647 RepID=UPI00101D0F64|nr:CoA pyrophosphatase [Salipiger sp. IMCC34102]RYH04197.1 CoA pyrophosphatase [Salipiger sp. IMCC34102]
MARPDLESRLTQALARAGRPSTDFDLNPEVASPGQTLRQAGVLIAVDPGRETVVLTKRSPALKHHPGQVAFPGGKLEITDADVTACALREAREEVGLDPACVRVLGQMPPHETVTGFHMTPVIGLIEGPYTPRAEWGEVSEVFTVPLAHVTDPARFVVQSRAWRGSLRHYYTVPYGPYYIWGASARILRALAERMA